MPERETSASLEGLVLEAVEWLPSGADAGLLRVRGAWSDLGRREADLPALGLRRGGEVRRFESLPDARFGRDAAVWRGTYLVPAALMDPAPHELWLLWASGAQAALPEPARAFDPPGVPAAAAAPDPGGEVIDRAVLAERRARRAEAAERAQARRATEALKAVEVLELRSAELERRLEALQAESARDAAPTAAPAESAAGLADEAGQPSARVLAEPAAPTAAPEEPAAVIADEAATAPTAAPEEPAAVIADEAAATTAAREEPGAVIADEAAATTAAPEEPAAVIADEASVGPSAAPEEAAAVIADEASVGPTAGAGQPSARIAGEPAALGGGSEAPVIAIPRGAVPEPPADATAAALAEAVATVKRLRYELGDQRQRLRKSELLRSADAVALASVREAAGRARRLEQELAARGRELAAALAAADERAAEAAAAREQAAEQVAQAARRSAADAAAVRRRAEEELAAARAAVSETREQLEATRRDLSAERTAHEEAGARLAGREAELAAIGAELSRVRAELATVRDDAAARAAGLERRLAELEDALAEERRAHGIAATERETARAGLARAESLLSAESVARAALDEELDRERLARASLIRALEAAQTELTAARTTQSDLVLSREQARAEAALTRAELEAARAAAEEAGAEAASTRAELEAARAAAEEAGAEAASTRAELEAARAAAEQAGAEAASTRAELEAARGLRTQLEAAYARISELEGDLEAARAAVADAGREAGGLLARIAELERTADDDLERRAREQADAAAAVPRPTPEEQRELSASIDAAAAALRARTEDVEAPGAPAGARDGAEATAAPSKAGAEVAPGKTAETASPAVRSRVVGEVAHASRADGIGSDYPWLRAALVRLARDDPRAATKLLLGLVPVQRALVEPPLEYDLTIRGSGTYAISIGQEGAVARSIARPRPRAEAAFHAAADVVTIAEVLAGVDKRIGRWLGSVRVRGRRGAAEALRAALNRASLDLASTVRAGADLDPDVVFRALAYAIHPSWTKGHSFTVAQEIAGPRPMRWHIAVRDGAPVAVELRSPAGPPDAVVSMSRAAFSHMLRGEPVPSGERPAIRGDREAVALLKAWTDRAQGRAG